MVAGLFAVRNR